MIYVDIKLLTWRTLTPFASSWSFSPNSRAQLWVQIPSGFLFGVVSSLCKAELSSHSARLLQNIGMCCGLKNRSVDTGGGYFKSSLFIYYSIQIFPNTFQCTAGEYFRKNTTDCKCRQSKRNKQERAPAQTISSKSCDTFWPFEVCLDKLSKVTAEFFVVGV